jgi:aminopeptidase N
LTENEHPLSTHSDTLNVVYLSDYAPPAFLIDTIDLCFDLDPDITKVKATSTFRRNPDSDAASEDLTLNGEHQDLIAIHLDGTALNPDRYTVQSDGLTLHKVPESFQLSIETSVSPKQNKALEGLYLSSERFCTQCEAEGFRRITYFMDRPDVLARYRVELRADKDKFPVLLSNGNKVSEGNLEGGRHFAVWEDPFPKPSYLFALVAGDLGCLSQTFETASQKTVALNLFVEHGKEDKAQYALESLKRAMRWDEEVYGLEYDLDEFNIVAVSDFNMGAMENKSLNIFNDKYILADPETATDTDYELIEAIVAHEYFHNWTGNRITCRDWFQLSLKEGLTVFRDQQFSADMRSPGVKRIEDVNVLRATQFVEDEGPLAHPVRPDRYSEINNFYTHTVYEKGAEVVRMIYSILGADAFYRGMDLYVERHDGQAVTCEDFVQAMSDASGMALDQFMLWYEHAGTPIVTVSGAYDAEARRYSLKLKQRNRRHTEDKVHLPFSIPVSLGFVDGDQGALACHQEGVAEEASATHTVMLNNEEADFCFNGFPEGAASPLVSVNRGFCAPIIVEMDRRPEDLAVLVSHDPDPFIRWDAMQELTLRVLLGKISATVEPPTVHAFEHAFSQVIAGAAADPAETASMLAAPSYSVISDRMDVIDPHRIHNAQQWLFRTCSETNKTELLDLYNQFQVDGPYAPNATDSGKRSLSNAALKYLVYDQSGDGITLAGEQFNQSNNMTNRWSALVALNDFDCDHRLMALTDFYERYAEDPLVLDKWFSLEATAALPKVLERVRNLLEHPKYDRTNPNRIRSLIGSFAAKNPTAFHSPDGAGYRFVADHIIDIDGFNPQVAARLAGSFQTWTRYDEKQKGLMQANLKRVLSHAGISKDVTEIVKKSLDQG